LIQQRNEQKKLKVAQRGFSKTLKRIRARGSEKRYEEKRNIKRDW